MIPGPKILGPLHLASPFSAGVLQSIAECCSEMLCIAECCSEILFIAQFYAVSVRQSEIPEWLRASAFGDPFYHRLHISILVHTRILE